MIGEAKWGGYYKGAGCGICKGGLQHGSALSCGIHPAAPLRHAIPLVESLPNVERAKGKENYEL